MSQIRKEAPQTLAPEATPGAVGVEQPLGPLVSVVMAGFNQADGVRRAVTALGAADGNGTGRIEIVAVDCGSRDGSQSLDTDFPSLTMLRLPHHIGWTRAMNIGMRTAKGEHILLLSPDVEISADAVLRLAAALDENASWPAVCPLLVDGDGRAIAQCMNLPGPNEMSAVCAGKDLDASTPAVGSNPIPVAYPGRRAMLVRKQFIRGMNYLDERFGEFWADADLAYQISTSGKKIYILPKITASFRPGPDPLAGDSLAEGDKISGAAALVGKLSGSMGGLMFRLKHGLAALVTFRFGTLGALLGGQMIDGKQVG